MARVKRQNSSSTAIAGAQRPPPSPRHTGWHSHSDSRSETDRFLDRASGHPITSCSLLVTIETHPHDALHHSLNGSTPISTAHPLVLLRLDCRFPPTNRCRDRDAETRNVTGTVCDAPFFQTPCPVPTHAPICPILLHHHLPPRPGARILPAPGSIPSTLADNALVSYIFFTSSPAACSFSTDLLAQTRRLGGLA